MMKNSAKVRIKLILVLFGILFLWRSSTAQNAFFTSKIHSLHPKPIVKVELNGKTAFFLLDTGSDFNIVNNKSAGKFNFKTFSPRNKKFLLSTANGSLTDYFHAYNLDLTMNGIKIAATFLSLDLEAIINSIKQKSGFTIDGIIGSETMKLHKFIINYEQEEITMYF